MQYPYYCCLCGIENSQSSREAVAIDPRAAKQQAVRLIWPRGEFMYYVKLCVYYAITVLRTLLLLLFVPVKWLGTVVVDTVSEWELDEPKRLTDVDDSDLLDYLNAEDPYYSKHHAKKQQIKE